MEYQVVCFFEDEFGEKYQRSIMLKGRCMESILQVVSDYIDHFEETKKWEHIRTDFVPIRSHKKDR